MPFVRIEMYKGFSTDYREAVFEAVHEALVFAFKIPDSDRHQVIYEFDDENFERGPVRTRQFLMIDIAAFAGRSRDAKRALYQRIAANLAVSPGIPPGDILISLSERELVNWGVAGGKVADEVDLGFEVKV